MESFLDVALLWLAIAVGVVAFVYCASVVSGRFDRGATGADRKNRRGQARPWGVMASAALGRWRKPPPPHDEPEESGREPQVVRSRPNRLDD